MDNYKKEEREKVSKVISGKAKRKKKSELQKFGNALISEDANQVGDHIMSDVLVPAIKTLVCDIVTDGIRMILFGETKGGHNRGGTANYVSYSTSNYNSSYSGSYARRSNGYDFDDIWLDSKAEAQAVLDRMREIIRRYGVVRVSDMYEMVGFPSDYTDNKYGWASLNSAEIVRGREGYGFRLPKASPID